MAVMVGYSNVSARAVTKCQQDLASCRISLLKKRSPLVTDS